MCQYSSADPGLAQLVDLVMLACLDMWELAGSQLLQTGFGWGYSALFHTSPILP